MWYVKQYDHQAIPGVLEYSGARIQLLDLPGIVEGASQGTWLIKYVVQLYQLGF